MKVFKRNQTDESVEQTTLKEVLDFIKKHNEVECDTETWGFDPHTKDVLCIQFGNRYNQYLIEWKDELVEVLKPLMEDSEREFIFQNAKFDLQFLYKKGIVVSKIYDTLLAEIIITNGAVFKGRGLDDLVLKYAKAYMSKEVRDTIVRVGLTEAVVDYGLNDVKYLSIIKEEQMKKVVEYDLINTLKLDNEFVKVLAYTEYCGIAFNSEKWLEKCTEEEAEWLKKEQELSDLVIKDGRLQKYVQYGSLFDPPGTLVCTVNWRSPQQVQELFKKIGVDVSIEDDGDIKDSVGKLVLQKNKDIPLVKTYSDYITLNKRITSFGKDYIKYINEKTGRIHTTYQQILNTGRMSSGNKTQKKPNLQQVPSDSKHRDCFIAPEGSKLICADYTGQEAVIFANKCMDKNLLAFYDKKLGDMHSYVAALCFPKELEGLTLDEIKKQRPDLRQKAKAAGFAIQFGGVGYTISNNLGISEDEGNEVYKGYTEAFPEMFDYFKKVSTESRENGYITFNSVTKRKFFFDFMDEFNKLEEKIKEKNFWSDYKKQKDEDSTYFNNVLKPMVKKYFKYKGVIERNSYNYPVQGSAADCTKYAAYLFWKWMLEKNLFGTVKFVNIVHDEIIVECPDNLVEECQKELKECMEKAGTYFCRRVPLSADPQIADRWVH